MIVTLTYVEPDGLKLSLRCRRKGGEVWFHLRDMRSCLGVHKQAIMFEAVNVRSFNDETHVKVQGVKRLFDACAGFEQSQHFIGWFNETVLGEQAVSK